MALLNKENIEKPLVPKETVTVDGLKGEVVVRGLLLSDRVKLLGNSGLSMSAFLAVTVVDANDTPIFTEQEWDAYGAIPAQFIECTELTKKAQALSGLLADVNKKK